MQRNCETTSTIVRKGLLDNATERQLFLMALPTPAPCLEQRSTRWVHRTLAMCGTANDVVSTCMPMVLCAQPAQVQRCILCCFLVSPTADPWALVSNGLRWSEAWCCTHRAACYKPTSATSTSRRSCCNHCMQCCVLNHRYLHSGM